MSDLYECGVCGREHFDGPTMCEKCYDALQGQIRTLRDDLAVNARLLAKQTDLNREHENTIARLRAAVEAARKGIPAILIKALSGQGYRTSTDFVQWGLVERDMLALLEAHPLDPAPCDPLAATAKGDDDGDE